MWFVFLTVRCLGSKKTFDRLLLGHYEKCCQIGYEQFLNLFHSPEIFHCSLLGCHHRMALFHHTLTNLNSLARFGPRDDSSRDDSSRDDSYRVDFSQDDSSQLRPTVLAIDEYEFVQLRWIFTIYV